VYAAEHGIPLLVLGTPEPGAEPVVDKLAAKGAEAPSFPEVFRSYSGFVWRVLLRLGVAEADVDDVAQEVFLGVHRNLPSFEGRCSLRTWVYGICHRRAIDYRRRASTRPEVPTDEPPDPGVEGGQEESMDLRRARLHLQQLLESLDEEKRAVFVLFEVEGIPMEEVAEIIGCPLQTAYSRLYAARKKVEALAQRMRAQGRSP
jgi:RNA polymerase sigma-70 factor (ECF subfamily)